jgi:hypothetical protein
MEMPFVVIPTSHRYGLKCNIARIKKCKMVSVFNLDQLDVTITTHCVHICPAH